jgi:hypothetical protein
MPAWTHGEKEVRQALNDADAASFNVVPTHTRGHSWGYIDCQGTECDGRFYVWSSPASAAEHAKQIRRFIRRHEHKED